MCTLPNQTHPLPVAHRERACHWQASTRLLLPAHLQLPFVTYQLNKANWSQQAFAGTTQTQGHVTSRPPQPPGAALQPRPPHSPAMSPFRSFLTGGNSRWGSGMSQQASTEAVCLVTTLWKHGRNGCSSGLERRQVGYLVHSGRERSGNPLTPWASPQTWLPGNKPVKTLLAKNYSNEQFSQVGALLANVSVCTKGRHCHYAFQLTLRNSVFSTALNLAFFKNKLFEQTQQMEKPRFCLRRTSTAQRLDWGSGIKPTILKVRPRLEHTPFHSPGLSLKSLGISHIYQKKWRSLPLDGSGKSQWRLRQAERRQRAE